MRSTKLLIKLLLPAVFYLSTANTDLHAQRDNKTIDFIGGYSQDGIGFNLNLNYFVDREQFIQGGIYYSKGVVKNGNIEVPFNVFAFNAGFFQDVFASRISSFKFSLGGGVLVGSEIVNNGENQLPSGITLKDRSKIIYGGYLSAEMELYLSNELSFVLKANENYHINSDLGELIPFFGAGLRYFID